MFKKLAIESGIATLIVFLAMWLLSLIPLNLSALQPLENAIKDIDIMDIYYSQVNKGINENFSHFFTAVSAARTQFLDKSFLNCRDILTLSL